MTPRGDCRSSWWHDRLAFGPARPLPSTWAVLPSEAAKRPGSVTVVNAEGAIIATIDPITRERRDRQGHLEATLTPQGWGRIMSDTAGVVFTKRPRAYGPDYEAGLDRRDVDPRSGARRRQEARD